MTTTNKSECHWVCNKKRWSLYEIEKKKKVSVRTPESAAKPVLEKDRSDGMEQFGLEHFREKGICRSFVEKAGRLNTLSDTIRG